MKRDSVDDMTSLLAYFIPPLVTELLDECGLLVDFLECDSCNNKKKKRHWQWVEGEESEKEFFWHSRNRIQYDPKI